MCYAYVFPCMLSLELGYRYQWISDIHTCTCICTTLNPFIHRSCPWMCTCTMHGSTCIIIYFRMASRLISLWPKVILEVDNEGDLPLHQACRQGNRDVVAVLLQQDQPQKDIELIQLARFCLDLKYRCALQYS